jgi:signal-transduction protein with cAMP-binding, CBS, and nucleotidyltransferase domain
MPVNRRRARMRIVDPGCSVRSARVFSSPVKHMLDRRKLLTAGPQTTVFDASQQMMTQSAGAVLVIQDERLIGIFTERDAVFRVIAQGRDARTTVLADVMTPSPKTIDSSHSFGYAMLLMHENGFRHLPVMEKGKPVGIVSARNALDPDLEEFVSESRRRKYLRESR